MRFQVNALTSAIRFGVAMGMVLAGDAAFAQQTSAAQGGQASAAADSGDQSKQTTNLQGVAVTGSLIRRVDVETSNPVITVSRDQIQASGKPTLGDILQQLPGMSGSMTNPAVNNGGGDGAATVSLRGLGSKRTLVLVDGVRVLNDDINAIPSSLIERVEVLKEGASAIYGSDAVGGVVNFITRKDYNGIEFSAEGGVSSHTDGQRRNGSFVMGEQLGKLHLLLGAEYNKQDGVSAGARKFSKDALYLSSGQVVAAGSSRTPAGVAYIPDGSGGSTRVARGADGTYHPYTSADAYNFQPYNLIETPQERSNAFILADYAISDNVSAYAHLFYNQTRSNSEIAPLPFDANSDGVPISASNPYNPFGVAFGPGGYEYLTRFSGLGNRDFHYSTNTNQDVLGLKGNFGSSTWQWDAHFNYGRELVTQQSFGYVNYAGLAAALNSSDPATALNIFDQASPEATAILSRYAENPVYKTSQYMRNWEATANGELWDLPAGPIQLAVGASYRKLTDAYNVPDIALASADGTCAISQEACSTPEHGSYNVKEVYFESLIPLLHDLPFAYSLNLTVGSRWSDYNTFGTTTNNKYAFEWRPVEDLLLRGTVAQVFRAPNIDEMYAGNTGDAPTAIDPCVGYSGSGHSNACAGVPVGYQGGGLSQLTGVSSGANAAGVNLQPERGKTYDWGLVYSPHWLDGFSVNADYWSVKLDNLVTNITAQTALNICYANDSSPYCSFIHRITSGPSSGQIQYVQEPTVNLGKLETSGVDFGFTYRLPKFDIAGHDAGQFTLGWDSTYLIKYDVDQTPGAPGDVVFHAAGKYTEQYGNNARWRGIGRVSWDKGNWDATWRGRWVGPISVGSRDPRQNISADGSVPYTQRDYGSIFYSDFSLTYTIPSIKTHVSVGVDNAFDKQPPLFFMNSVVNANTDVTTYDTLGRYWWARVSFEL
jgi:outer membrane receptor protein involved in Fe transport